jgi:hypothetical protein
MADTKLDFARHQRRAVSIHPNERQFIRATVLSGKDAMKRMT